MLFCCLLLDYKYDASSVERAKEFLTNCHLMLKDGSNLFWAAFQSNLLADLVFSPEDDFKNKMANFKEELGKDGFKLPKMAYNMRNSKNINTTSGRLTFDVYSAHSMQEIVEKLPSGNSSVLGEIPILYELKDEKDWHQKKNDILKHIVGEIQKNCNKKNIVLLHDKWFTSKDIQVALKHVPNYTIKKYPSNKGKEKGNANIKEFCEKANHILVTKSKYFNGCEASNLIYTINSLDGDGIARNTLMRGVQNVVIIDVCACTSGVDMNMKIDKTFLDSSPLYSP